MNIMAPRAIPEITDEIVRRFEDKYIPEPNSGCWLWTASTDPKGYGKIAIDRHPYIATRVSLAIAGRRPKAGENACHRCDNPTCVNPDHLFLGSQKENIHDMIAKGRHAVGERMPRSTLTSGQVLAIKFLHSLGRSGKKMAAQYGVATMTVSRIINGHAWKHITAETFMKGAR